MVALEIYSRKPPNVYSRLAEVVCIGSFPVRYIRSKPARIREHKLRSTLNTRLPKGKTKAILEMNYKTNH